MILINGKHDASGRCNHRFHLIVRYDRNILLCIGIQRILHCYPQYILIRLTESKRNHGIFLKDIYRNQLGCCSIYCGILQIHKFQIQLFAERHCDIILCQDSFIDQNLSQLHILALLFLQSIIQLFLRYCITFY